jgi:hypothetical protein
MVTEPGEEGVPMDKEARRRALVDALRSPTPEMRATLRVLKEKGSRELERPDFVWHLLLQSFSTWGSSRGWEGLIGNEENYQRVTYETLSRLGPQARLRELGEVFRRARIRFAPTKARLMARNFDLIAEMGGPEEARRLALALEGREAKMIFMRRFWGVGDKYARDIWMSAHDPDFRDAIAVDDRIKKVTRTLGYSFNSYEEHERFYQGVAAVAGLQPWEADRLLYEYQKVFLAAIQAGEKVRQTGTGLRERSGAGGSARS